MVTVVLSRQRLSAPMFVVVFGAALTSVLFLVNNHLWDAAESFAVFWVVFHFVSWMMYGDERNKAEAYLRELLVK